MTDYRETRRQISEGVASFETDRYRLKSLMTLWEDRAATDKEQDEAHALLHAIANHRYNDDPLRKENKW